MTAISPVFPETRLRAAGFGLYPRRSATSRTRWRVSGLSRPLSFSACETVVTETSASRATSLMLIRRSCAIRSGYSAEAKQRSALGDTRHDLALRRRVFQTSPPRAGVAAEPAVQGVRADAPEEDVRARSADQEIVAAVAHEPI